MMGGGYGYGRRLGGGGDEDFQEEDVWAVLSYGKDEGGSGRSSATGTRKAGSSSNLHPSANLATAGGRRQSSSRTIPRSSSSSYAASRQSAPVNIPDWSKIYRSAAAEPDDDQRHGGVPYSRDSGMGGRVSTPAAAGAGNYYYDGYMAAAAAEADDDDDDYNGGDGMVPPHEWLARKVAGTQISSFSMFEGIGRTLKGRDLRSVRNAVLTKTGFLEGD